MKSVLEEVRNRMAEDPDNAMLHLMEFVDEFRRSKDASVFSLPFRARDPRWDALVAATAESLCMESGAESPVWLDEVPACRDPWFVSGMESLKAIAIVESPLPFRRRKIFVLENFLARA
jgi:hypothetical protein